MVPVKNKVSINVFEITNTFLFVSLVLILLMIDSYFLNASCIFKTIDLYIIYKFVEVFIIGINFFEKCLINIF